MTLAQDRPEATAQVRADVTVTIDGFEVAVPAGTLVIRAAELVGVQIPRFCDHPLLDPVGACRQCLVEVEGQRKPIASCTVAVTDGMVVRTQLTSEMARAAQAGTIELLLINHPLDCPICDKGGECPLQNQAMSSGNPESRFHDVKRTYPKPLAISSQVLLDRERCVLCARCTRFSQEIAGDPFIDLFERGSLEQVSVFGDEPYTSYFSGNVIQICPVGALTDASYRFRARPFDLVSTPGVCEHCASGCALRWDHRRGRVQRRLAGADPEVNEEWNCDKGRWAFAYARQPERLTTPLVRDAAGELVAASWPAALERAAAGLAAARGRAGVLAGGRLTVEDAYAYAKFARVALGTDSVDFRARPHSAQEAAFLRSHLAGRGLGVTYADLERAGEVLLVGLEPEDESPIVFLRLRKAARRHGLRVRSVAPFTSAGLRKCGGELVRTVPGREAEALAGLELSAGAVVLLGERLATSPGALPAAVELARRCGARWAWVPRRAGERGAVDAGLLPGLLPGGRDLTDRTAREEVSRLWGVELPSVAGLDTAGMLAAAATGELAALVVAGVDPGDLPDPAAARAALARVPFLVSLEVLASEVTAAADVVLPVAPVAEKAGAFLDWEGRWRPFPVTVTTAALPDQRVLHVLAGEMGVALGLPDLPAVRAEIAALGLAPPAAEAPAGAEPAGPGATGHPAAAGSDGAAGPAPRPGPGQAVLATHAQLLDLGTLQRGEPHLAGTARPARALLAAATAASLGLREGEAVTVRRGAGSVTLPLALADLPEGVVWLPTNSPGCRVRAELGALPGTVVSLSKGAP